jgi:hypothetical protein
LFKDNKYEQQPSLFTIEYLVSLSINRYGKVAVYFCSDQGARKEHSLGYVTEEQRGYGQKDQDLVCNGCSGNDTKRDEGA